MSSTKTNRFLLMLLVSFGAAGLAAAQETTSLDTRAIVEYLADDELEGRLTGSPGIRMAADYLIGQLEAVGAEPLPGVGGFRQAFSYTAGVDRHRHDDRACGERLDPAGRARGRRAHPSAHCLSRIRGARQAGSFSPVTASRVPETDDFGYDSYATLDVTDKIVVVLRLLPGGHRGELRSTLARYAGLRFKALAARERGAAGSSSSPGRDRPTPARWSPLTFDTAVSDSGIVAATVDGELGAAIIESAGESIEAVQASLDTANPHVTGFDLPLEGGHRCEAGKA